MSIQYFRDLQLEFEEVEGSYKETVQQETRNFAQGLHKELNYPVTSNAQSQSLLTAEELYMTKPWTTTLRGGSASPNLILRKKDRQKPSGKKLELPLQP